MTRSCSDFAYSGCGGSDNRFMSIEHCRTVCLGHIFDPLRDITCSMPVRTGKCRGKSQHLKRYYYNYKTDRCYPFIYSGCNGNDNNFETYWECLAHCRKFLFR